MPDSTILCGRPGSGYCVTVGDYKAWENDADGGWSRKPDFLRRRLFERYIDPVKALDLHDDVKERKNGFYMMAVSCLLVETLASFWRGWETTEPHRDASGRKILGRSGEAFRVFFQEQTRLSTFQGTDFYRNVRCGILHQGETKSGWIIERTGPLFDGTNRINATKFHNQMAGAIRDYERALENPHSASSFRANCDRKMKAVLKNCE